MSVAVILCHKATSHTHFVDTEHWVECHPQRWQRYTNNKHFWRLILKWVIIFVLSSNINKMDIVERDFCLIICTCPWQSSFVTKPHPTLILWTQNPRCCKIYPLPQMMFLISVFWKIRLEVVVFNATFNNVSIYTKVSNI
jgi:hypothetical protein